MCMCFLVCVGLVHVVFYSALFAAVVLFLLVTFLLLLSYPYWYPGPVVDPHPEASVLAGCLQNPIWIYWIYSSLLAFSVEHALLVALLLAVHRRICHPPPVVPVYDCVYGTFE